MEMEDSFRINLFGRYGEHIEFECLHLSILKIKLLACDKLPYCANLPSSNKSFV